MKKFILISIAITIFSYISFGMAKHFWRGEIMPKERVCKNWPSIPFDSRKYKEGNEETRASMACALIENQKQFLGRDRSEIRKELGDYDGFYFSDMFPAYMIQSGKSQAEDSWQLVFILDKNEKVSEIVVHKNCCERQ